MAEATPMGFGGKFEVPISLEFKTKVTEDNQDNVGQTRDISVSHQLIIDKFHTYDATDAIFFPSINSGQDFLVNSNMKAPEELANDEIWSIVRNEEQKRDKAYDDFKVNLRNRFAGNSGIFVVGGMTMGVGVGGLIESIVHDKYNAATGIGTIGFFALGLLFSLNNYLDTRDQKSSDNRETNRDVNEIAIQNSRIGILTLLAYVMRSNKQKVDANKPESDNTGT